MYSKISRCANSDAEDFRGRRQVYTFAHNCHSIIIKYDIVNSYVNYRKVFKPITEYIKHLILYGY